MQHNKPDAFRMGNGAACSLTTTVSQLRDLEAASAERARRGDVRQANQEQELQIFYADCRTRLESCAEAEAQLISLARGTTDKPLRGDGKFVADQIAAALKALQRPLQLFSADVGSTLWLKGRKVPRDLEILSKNALAAAQKALHSYERMLRACAEFEVAAAQAFDVFEVRPNSVCDIPAETAVKELLASSLATIDVAVLLTKMMCLAEDELLLDYLLPEGRKDVECDLVAIKGGLWTLRQLAVSGQITPPVSTEPAEPPPYTKHYLLFHSQWLTCHRKSAAGLIYDAADSGGLRNFILERYAVGDDNQCPQIEDAAKRLSDKYAQELPPPLGSALRHEIDFRSIDSEQVNRVVNHSAGEKLAQFCMRFKGVHLRVKQLARSTPTYKDVVDRVDQLKGIEAANAAAAVARQTIDEIDQGRAPRSNLER